MIQLKSCLKTYTAELDKALAPAETVARVKELFAGKGQGLLEDTRRIDVGRLGIPVYLSVAGPKARTILPTRKQMGKGSTPEQAEASALMELVERISFFSFWQSFTNFTLAGYSDAQKRWPGQVMDVRRILQSVQEDMSPKAAVEILDLVRWRFCRATDLTSDREERVPYGWFKMLGEFNGSSAGNTQEESILQGAAELVERHVCALVDRDRPSLPTIDPQSFQSNPVLAELYRKFTDQGIRVLLKDFSMGLPLPTVGALAYDPATFPGLSEIVFTAGTATSPEKAAIRALTEVAQLAGDFTTDAVYEASGLSKYSNLTETVWLESEKLVSIHDLPRLEHPDIAEEIRTLCLELGKQGFSLYSVDISNPALGLPAHYSFVPGFQFRERDPHASLGMFVSRYLAEEAKPHEAAEGLKIMERHYPGAFFLPFFQGLLALRLGETTRARQLFEASADLQPNAEKQAMALFYAGYSTIQENNFSSALPHLDQAIQLCPDVKEYFNQRGVALFKLNRYEEAAKDFSTALNLDRGSAIDLANLGMCMIRLGNKKQGEDYLRTALELDPTLEFAKNQLDS